MTTTPQTSRSSFTVSVVVLRDRFHVPSEERAAVFGRGVLGYSTQRMLTTTTTMTSARIAMLRVLMATSVYLVAPEPARAHLASGSGRRGRAQRAARGCA